MADEFLLTDEHAPTEDGAGREPQHNLLAEQSALGGMMLSRTGDEVDDVFSVCRADDFYNPRHPIIAEAIQRLHNSGKPTDVIAVADELAKTGHLARVGGAEYLHELTSITSTAANAGYWASLVAEDAVRRRLVVAGAHIQQMGYSSEGEISDLVDQARAEVEGITTVRTNELRSIDEGLMEFMDVLEQKPQHMPTGWRALDFKIGGFARGEMHVVAARPGQGKSLVLLNAAMAAARRGVVAFTSLEMKLDQLQTRLVADFGDIHMKSLRDHNLTDQDWLAYKRAMDRLKGAPVYVDVTPSATIASIRAHARAVGKKSPDGKPLMVVVDYLQLVDGPGQNRELEVSGVARELKKLALDMDVIVLVAAQLNRGQPNRGGVIPAPTLRDLRESGGIEANADGVILLHRDEKKPAFVDFIIAKARQGEVGTVQMRWQPSFARVLDPVSHANEPLFDVGGMQ